MSTLRPIMLASAVAVVAIIVVSTAAQAQPTVYTSPAHGDASITVPAGTTIVLPAQTGAPRVPEDVNQPGAVVTRHSDSSAPIPDEAMVNADSDVPYLDTPQVQTAANGVSYVSGGVGLHDKAQMESMQKDFRLKLMFAAASGPYLANVAVTITDKAGTTVLSTTTEGPFLLVNLPAGSYTVNATYENATSNKKVAVAKSGLRGYTLTFSQPLS